MPPIVATAPDAQRPPILGLMVGALAYVGLAALGMSLFALQPSNITLLWLPIGVGLLLCLEYGRRAWPWIFVATLVANFPGMARDPLARHLLHAGVSALVDTAAAAAAAAALRRSLPDGLQRPGQLLRFVGLVCLLPISVSSALLALNLAAGGYIAPSAIGGFIAMLLFADTLGLLLVYPLFAAWRRRVAERTARPGELLAAAAALGFALLAFLGVPAALFFVLPTLLFLVYHGREHVVATGLLLCICLIIGMAAQGLGPFAIGDADTGRTMLQAYLLTTAIVVNGAALQQYHLEHATRERESWYRQALQDALTGLPNRRGLLERLAHRRQGPRAGLPLSVAMVDIDHFKHINDQHGHAVGDAVLRMVGQRLRDSMRGEDLAARYGGEEFTLVFDGLRLEAAATAVERLRAAFAAAPLRVEGRDLAVRISAGVAERAPGDSDDALLALADRRLYAAKRLGRDRVVAASDD